MNPLQKDDKGSERWTMNQDYGHKKGPLIVGKRQKRKGRFLLEIVKKEVIILVGVTEGLGSSIISLTSRIHDCTFGDGKK